MIKFKKLSENVSEKIPYLISELKKINELVAFYLHGSFATGKVNPLSDIDFAILFDLFLPHQRFFELESLARDFIETELNTEDYDLINMNLYPDRFSHNILRTGKILICKNQKLLADFIEQNNMRYLDFNFYRREYDKEFLIQMGVHND